MKFLWEFSTLSFYRWRWGFITRLKHDWNFKCVAFLNNVFFDMSSARFLLFSLASTMKMSKSYATVSRTIIFITRFSKKWLMKFDYEEIFGLSVSITFAVDNFLFLNRLWVFILFSIFCCRSQTFYEFFSLSLFSSPSVSNLYRWFHFHFLLFSTKNNPGIFLGCTHTFEASQFTCKLRRFNCKLSN